MTLRCFAEDLQPSGHCGPRIRMISLSPEESRHARLARRLAVGDAVELFDGRGGQASGRIATCGRETVQVEIADVQARPRSAPVLTLMVSMPKGPRQDVLIEKCTELGAAVIQPLITERSVSVVSGHKRDKWRRATIEAAKQSGERWLPELPAPMDLPACLETLGRFDLVVACMIPCAGRRAVALPEFVSQLSPASTVAAMVGPEGGWSPAEEEQLLSAGALALSLGPNVLRIETAAILVAGICHGVAIREA